MRDDTRLVFIDIPGTNEAHSDQLYLDHVKKSWDEFDCVIVVIDANSGANTEEQVNLLKLVNQHTKKIKDIPVLVLCNKVDNPNNKEVMGMVAEARKEVERIFGVTDRVKALTQALAGKSSKGKARASPCFIPISAENAFLYRHVSKVPLADYNLLDKTYLERIGYKEAGENTWPELSRQEKHQLVHKVLRDPKKYKNRIEKSNFDKVLTTLSYFLGGEAAHDTIMEKQLGVAMKKLSTDSSYVDSLCKIYDRSVALGKPTKHLKDKFWSLYGTSSKKGFDIVRNDVQAVAFLIAPMAELIKYEETLHKKLHASATTEVRNADQLKIYREMTGLIQGQIQLVLEMETAWTLTSQHMNLNAAPPKRNLDDAVPLRLEHDAILLPPPFGRSNVLRALWQRDLAAELARSYGKVC